MLEKENHSNLSQIKYLISAIIYYEEKECASLETKNVKDFIQEGFKKGYIKANEKEHLFKYYETLKKKDRH